MNLDQLRTIKQLEARLAESEAMIEHWRNASVSNFDAGKEFKDKLAQAEARIKELEAERVAHLLLIDGQAKEIEELRAALDEIDNDKHISSTVGDLRRIAREALK